VKELKRLTERRKTKWFKLASWQWNWNKPCASNIVALAVERPFSRIPMVGMCSHTWRRF